MNEVLSPALLSRDQEMLDRVASLLRAGRRGFSVLVCPERLWGDATRYLAERSGRDIAEPREIRTGDEMVGALTRIEGKAPSEVESIAIADGGAEVATALNWHRDKMRKGAHLLVWVRSEEGLSMLVRQAPDAYSYRDHTIGVSGTVEPTEGWAGEEPLDVRTARLLFELPRAPEERAQAAVELSGALMLRGEYEESARVAAEGLESIPAAGFGEERYRDIRIALLQQSAKGASLTGRAVELVRICRRGAHECDASERERAHQRLWFEMMLANALPLPGNKPFVEGLVREGSSSPNLAVQRDALLIAIHDSGGRGHLRRALRACESLLRIPNVTLNSRALDLALCAAQSAFSGRLDQAGAHMSAADAAFVRAGHDSPPTASGWAALWLNRAEIAAAQRCLATTDDAGISAPGLTMVLEWFRTDGSVTSGLQVLARQITDWLAGDRSQYVQRACASVCGLLGGRRFPRVDRGAIDLALEVIDAAGRALIERAGEDPPWYRVLFPAYRASLLSLYGDRHEEAIRAASESIALARSLWVDALPTSTQRLVRCLAQAGRWATMEPAVRMALDAAREADDLLASSSVQAMNLVRLVKTGAPRATVESALGAVRQTFSEMDAPRVEAETWLDIEPFLPATSTFPDAVEIADRAHDLFFDMPMPEMAARCMEWLGDIHAARGESARAESCYRMCLGTLERYSLRPRQPLVEEKLSSVLRKG